MQNNVIKKASNKWTKGLVMDFSPENTGNEVLTHALNATFLTFNGNELSLQNDMGNARVETAFLPEGYIPVGTCEYGGIIYIVSYNPLEDKSQIGCFPSPERNISSDELGVPTQIIQNNDFVDDDGNIKNVSKYVLLKNDKLNPGDKFIITANEDIYEEKLKDLFIRTKSTKVSNPGSIPGFISNYDNVSNPVIALNIVSIEDSGKIIYLNSDIKKYEVDYEKNQFTNTYKYHILGTNLSNSETVQQDIDEYRNVLSSGYSVFKSKTSGKLAILAELIMIDSYSVTHSIQPKQDANGKDIPNEYDIIIHTEAFSEETNYRTAPKLKYYYLNESFGGLYSYIDDDPISLFDDNDNYNDSFFDTNLSMIYQTKDTNLQKQLTNTKLKDVATFNFPKPKTYHGEIYELFTEPFDKNLPSHVFTKFYGNKFHIVNPYQLQQILDDPEINIKIYSAEEGFIPREIPRENLLNYDQVYVVVSEDMYIPSNKFTPNINDNNIKGYESNNYGTPISLHIISDSLFLTNYDLTYNSVKLASIKLPEINNKGVEQFPFKYEYTLIPCMNYGKLEHLAVSNKIDFSKIFDFDSSNFNIWKYRIDNDQLKLTFGAEIYDTNSNKKVTGLILEFYDHRGFAGSFQITDKKSYSGVFTKIISLNSLGALSNYQIIENTYKKSNYKRNAAIVETKDKDKDGNSIFKLNNKIVKYIDSENGWKYKGSIDIDQSQTPDSPDLTKGIENSIMPNDCGTLYSNFLYGVKAYFKINDENNEVHYIKKDEFFLYTFPFYNEKYHNCDNFNTLPGPTLDMVLTYKLDDQGTKSEYTGSNIENGYNTTNQDTENGIDSDKNYVDKYFKGEDLIKDDKIITDLNIIKYYKYEGPTHLYLEVGLKKDYENYSLGCSPEINNYFSCDLQLISNDESNKQLTVTGGEYENQNLEDILNYSDITMNDLNTISFKESNEEDKSIIKLNNLSNIGFYNNQGNRHLNINYNFVVGYKINISGIRKSEIPATTVCALCHKKPNGEYNYEDFGIYLGESDNYLSNCMFYNSGNKSNIQFGIGKQRNYLESGGNLSDYVNIEEIYTNDYTDVNNSHPLNSGDALKKALQYIGKLQFCQPHIHVINSENGVNVQASEKDENILCIIPDYEKDNDITRGTVGSHKLYYYPRFNLSFNTENSINYQENFISSMDFYKYENVNVLHYSVIHGSYSLHYHEIISPIFYGMSVNKLVDFNYKLITTMKNVYAYNPDYDSRLVNIGEISTQTYNPQFISNLICTNSEFKFDNKSLNDYVTINSFTFSTYLNDLKKYSLIELNNQNGLKQQIQLNPSYTYCGKEGNPYLITTLTYNTTVPEELKHEFEYISTNIITIKKEDGTIEQLKGTLENKKILFGYYNKKLIQLDVSNYTIDESGKLIMNISQELENNINYVDQTSNSVYSYKNETVYEIKDAYKNSCLCGTSIVLNDLLYDPYSEHNLYIKEDRFTKSNYAIFYRKAYSGTDNYIPDFDNDWLYSIDKNVLRLYTGPCFTHS